MKIWHIPCFGTLRRRVLVASPTPSAELTPLHMGTRVAGYASPLPNLVPHVFLLQFDEALTPRRLVQNRLFLGDGLDSIPQIAAQCVNSSLFPFKQSEKMLDEDTLGVSIRQTG